MAAVCIIVKEAKQKMSFTHKIVGKILGDKNSKDMNRCKDCGKYVYGAKEKCSDCENSDEYDKKKKAGVKFYV
jgi:uncharacterized OB-fold protein